MNRIRTIACAAALPVAVLAMAAQHAVAATASVPVDWVTLTDDSVTIAVDVPAAWTDVWTHPIQSDNGESFPAISASTDLQLYRDTFDVAGMTYAAVTFDPDTAAAAQRWELTSGCAAEETLAYDDGMFVGTHVAMTSCGGGTAEFHTIAANPADQAFTAVLNIQITGPAEYPVLDGILRTFNRTDASTPAPVATTAATQAATDGFPPPAGAIPADWTSLVDDTQSIELAVPPTWSDVSADAQSNGGHPTIQASTDNELFSTGDFTVPGVRFTAFTFSADTEGQTIDDYLFQQCTDAGVQTYDDTVFVGHIRTYTGCGGQATTAYTIAANAPDGSFTALLKIQLLGEPDDALTLNGILLGFNRMGPETAAATTAPAPPTATGAPVPTTQVTAAPAGQLPSGWTTVVDDTQTIQIAVPSTWTYVETMPNFMDNPSILATPDQAGFDALTSPGLTFEAREFEPHTEWFTELAFYNEVCTIGGVEPFDNGVLVGNVQLYTECGGTSTAVYRVFANPPDSSFSASIVIQLAGGADDAAVLETLLSSIGPHSG